jgi:hypothetical protein
LWSSIGIAVVVEEVVAVDVVDEAVVVVINAVAGDLAGVDPDVGGEVGMGVIDAGVDDGHDDVAAAGGAVPGLGCVDVGVERAAALSGVVQAPQRAELRIVGDLVDLEAVAGNGGHDAGAGAIGGERGLDGDAARQLDLPQTGKQRERILEDGAVDHVELARVAGVGAEADENMRRIEGRRVQSEIRGRTETVFERFQPQTAFRGVLTTVLGTRGT